MKIRADISKMLNRETIDKNKNKSWLFEKINENDKLLAILTKAERRKTLPKFFLVMNI